MNLKRLVTALRLTPFAVPALLVVVFLFHAVMLRRWLLANVLPNGYQNEILHLGNALDLWVAWRQRDWHLLHDLLFTQYWPPLHYLSAFPLLAIERSRDMFVYANLFFLALLLVTTYALGKRLESRAAGALAAVFVSFFPSIFGNLRHFEPNVPLTALVALSIWALSSSHRLQDRAFSLLFGIAAGLTLMVDRISGAFFLALPSAAVLFSALYGSRRQAPARRRQIAVNAAIAAAAGLLIAGYYYVNFARFHRDEILSQAVEGEILETGLHTEVRDPLAPTTLLFYPLSLIDGQAGFGLGCILAVAALLALWRGERRHRLLWLWLLGPWVLFTLIQKKQLYYTIPVLPAFALLAAIGLTRALSCRVWTVIAAGALLIAVHQHQLLSFGQGLLPDRRLLSVGGKTLLIDLSALGGASPLPVAWVAPRYPQSLPPLREDLKVREILATLKDIRGDLPSFRVLAFSEDFTFFEGYLTFFIRCDHPLAIVNGLIQYPQGFYENIRLMDALVYVTPSSRRFPTAEAIDEALRTRASYRQAESLPITSVLEAQVPKLELRRALTLSTGVRAYVYGLKPWRELTPHP